MPTLAFDTSQDQTVAVLADADGNVLAQVSAGDRAQSALDAIDQVLVAAGVDRTQIERIAVGIGPGSFTAVRIGVTTARGLAFALGIPLAGLDTLAVVAAGAGDVDGTVWAAVDARRGELFARRFQLAVGDLPRPDGPLQTVASDVVETLVNETPVRHEITAAALARLAITVPYAEPDTVHPVYGREPDAVPTADRPAVTR